MGAISVIAAPSLLLLERLSSGRRAIRTLEAFRPSRLAGGCLRPLGHPSTAERGRVELPTVLPARRFQRRPLPFGHLSGGGSGIRTHGPLRTFRVRTGCLQPDSAIPPRSDRVVSNHRPQPYQGCVLPLNYDPMVARQGIEPRRDPCKRSALPLRQRATAPSAGVEPASRGLENRCPVLLDHEGTRTTTFLLRATPARRRHGPAS